jgi:hypothetical protein
MVKELKTQNGPIDKGVQTMATGDEIEAGFNFVPLLSYTTTTKQ